MPPFHPHNQGSDTSRLQVMWEEKKNKSGLGWNKEEDRGQHGPVVWGVTHNVECEVGWD